MQQLYLMQRITILNMQNIGKIVWLNHCNRKHDFAKMNMVHYEKFFTWLLYMKV